MIHRLQKLFFAIANNLAQIGLKLSIAIGESAYQAKDRIVFYVA